MRKIPEGKHGQRHGSALRIRVLSQPTGGEHFEGSNDPFPWVPNKRSRTFR